MVGRRDILKGIASLPFVPITVPKHWDWLTDKLTTVRMALPGELPNDAAAGLLVRPNAYVAVIRQDYGAPYNTSLIAHEAWHAYQHQQGRRYYGRAAEQEAWAVQATVLSDISPNHHAVPWLLTNIANLPDGEPLTGNPR